MLYLARIKDGFRWVYIVFSAASLQSENVSIHGVFDSYSSAKRKYGNSLVEYSHTSTDDIPARLYA